MASSRRASNGRSPLVRKQSQITSFFSPGKSSGESSNPAATPKTTSPGQKNPNPSPRGHRRSPGPTPPSKQTKPLLVVGHTPVSSLKATELNSERNHCKEVVGRRLKVFWPLDNAWYEGYVKSFDGATGKHVIQYDDAEEEVLDLGRERIEWVEEEAPPPNPNPGQKNPNPTPSCHRRSPGPTLPSKQAKPPSVVGHTPVSSSKAAELNSGGNH